MNENELILAIGKMFDEKLDAKFRTELGPIKDRLYALDEGQKLIREDIAALRSQVSENTQILRALREHSDVNKAEHDVIKIDIAYMKGDIVGLKQDFAALKLAKQA